MISVAMCTYNGSRYIDDQLSSILSQTRTPDELIACDDNSTDDTVTKLERFAHTAPFPVRIFVNTVTLGSTANFDKAINLCAGDIIALSDQDDVWLSWRLQDTENMFAANPAIGCVFGDGHIIDDQGCPTEDTLWKAWDFTLFRRWQVSHGQSTRALLNHHVATGATMAFRSSLRKYVLPIPLTGTHDSWIALISSCVSGMGLLPRPAIKYRRHRSQQIGATYTSFIERIKRPRNLGLQEYEDCFAQYGSAYQRLSEIGGAAKYCTLIAAKTHHLYARNFLPQQRHRRIPTIIKELLSLRYTLYSAGLLSAIRDLIVNAR